MRITGGELRNIRIKVPQGIRPTQDNVRLAIFNILGEKIKGVRFVDLFAGSGAVGIEALSRGASKVTFVEHSKKVIEILKENIKNTGYCDKSDILVKDARNVLIDEFDILFADPPYDKGYLTTIIQNYKSLIQGTGVASKKGIYQASLLILEHSKYEEIETRSATLQGRFSASRNYKFGDTVITFVEYGVQ